MLKKIIFILFINFVAMNISLAQDIHFTQFYAVPLYLNPSIAGAEQCPKFTAAARSQWNPINKGYRTGLFSYDIGVPKYNSGVGFVLASDIAGTGGFKTILFNVNYAYEALLSRKLAIRFGVQAGFQQRSVTYGNLLFADQVIRGGNVSTIEQIEKGKIFADIGAGTFIYTKKSWIGLALSHLNRPNESLLSYKAILPIKTSVHAGMRIRMNNPVKKNETKWVVPVLNYQHQNKFNQISWGMYYQKVPVSFGLMYRGIPFTNYTQPGYSTNDAISFLIGIGTDKFHFGYSYDATLSRLTMASGGSNEITCSYKICKKKKKKKYTLLLPCPKF